jgi:cellulose synthase/poly-beta-1,6-N-acetylglucosamine synthase-like glycosyltransferase
LARFDLIGRPAAVDIAPGDEEAVYRDRARQLGLPYTAQVDLGPNPYSDLDAINRGVFAKGATDEGLAYLAPDETMVAAVSRWLAAHPTARRRLFVAPPTAIRAALRQADRKRYVKAALDRLDLIDPGLSARRMLTLPRLASGLAIAAILGAVAVMAPVATIMVIDLTAAFFFLGASLLRFAAAGQVPLFPRKPRTVSAGTHLPVYTVLVPLLHEAHIVSQLVAALDRIAWPRDRLDIKLIVEEDDLPTRAAAARATRGAPFEIIVVPAGGPRTKPMALQYALTFARGDFVTVYDAEDRPHPDQLGEAFETFRQADERLACLQAPIIVDNHQAGLLARLFAVEYSTLFDGLLPALARLDLPLPLGGTSNHFRRSALEQVGGWDPFNVTEDADLGIRLVRFGYRAATITLPTYEEAPAATIPWIRQRTRWFKGWMQTWLVHMGRPMRLYREIGFRGLLGFNLIGLGMIVSAIAHPAFLVTPFLIASNPLDLWRGGDLVIAAIVGLNLFNLVAGYMAVAVLAGRTLALRGRKEERSVLVWLPFYWLLMAVACVRALFQLIRRPHLWEKTPHVGRPAGRSPRQPAVRSPPQPRLAASRRRA